MWPQRFHRDETAVTIVEVMVVVLVIGIIIGIGLPVFLGAKARSQERAAHAQLRTALVGGLTHWSTGATYTNFDQGCSAAADSCTAADAVETSVEWVGPGQPGARQVSVVFAQGNSLLLVTRSETDEFFCIAQSTGQSDRGRGPTFADVDTLVECAGGW